MGKGGFSESTVKSPDLGVENPDLGVVNGGLQENCEALIVHKDSDISSSSGEENKVVPDDIVVSKGKRLTQATTEESICVKRAKCEEVCVKRAKCEEVGVLGPIFRSKYADLFICQRCGTEVNAETLVKLRAIKCSSCRFIVWFPPRYIHFKDGKRLIRPIRNVNIYPEGHTDEMRRLKERFHSRSCFVSFPYGEDNLMDFEVTIIPTAGLYKRAKVVFSVDVPPWYPEESPVVRCKTKIFHPLISLEGNVGIGIIGDSWSEDHRLSTVIRMLKDILTVRSNELWGCPVVVLNHEADAVWKMKRKRRTRKVRETLGGGFVGETYYPKCLIEK